MKFKMFLSCFLLLLSTPSAIVHAQSNGELRLARRLTTSRFFTNGRLEIFLNGQWGTICDDSFDLDDANVACRQLGWTGATAVDQSFLTLFDSGSGPIWLDEVECHSENDHHILSCNHNDIGNHDCSHFEDVAIYCTSTPIYNNPSELDVRLQDGRFISQGRVEVYCNGEWGTICEAGGFAQNEADTACRQMGYTHATMINHFSLPGDVEQPVWLPPFECASSDTSLAQCSEDSCPIALSYDYQECSHRFDVTIACDYDPDRIVTEGTATYAAVAATGGTTVIIVCCFIAIFCYLQKKKSTPTTTTSVRTGFALTNPAVISVQQQQPQTSYQVPTAHVPLQNSSQQFQPALTSYSRSTTSALPALPSPHYPPYHASAHMEPTPVGDRYADEAPPSYELAVAGYGVPGGTLGPSQAPHQHQGN